MKAIRFLVSGVELVTAHDHDKEVAALRKQLDEADSLLEESQRTHMGYYWDDCVKEWLDKRKQWLTNEPS